MRAFVRDSDSFIGERDDQQPCNSRSAEVKTNDFVRSIDNMRTITMLSTLVLLCSCAVSEAREPAAVSPEDAWPATEIRIAACEELEAVVENRKGKMLFDQSGLVLDDSKFNRPEWLGVELDEYRAVLLPRSSWSGFADLELAARQTRLRKLDSRVESLMRRGRVSFQVASLDLDGDGEADRMINEVDAGSSLASKTDLIMEYQGQRTLAEGFVGEPVIFDSTPLLLQVAPDEIRLLEFGSKDSAKLICSVPIADTLAEFLPNFGPIDPEIQGESEETLFRVSPTRAIYIDMKIVPLPDLSGDSLFELRLCDAIYDRANQLLAYGLGFDLAHFSASSSDFEFERLVWTTVEVDFDGSLNWLSPIPNELERNIENYVEKRRHNARRGSLLVDVATREPSGPTERGPVHYVRVQSANAWLSHVWIADGNSVHRISGEPIFAGGKTYTWPGAGLLHSNGKSDYFCNVVIREKEI